MIHFPTKLAMDLGFSGWPLSRRYEVWVTTPTKSGERFAMRDWYGPENQAEKWTRRRALRFAWSIALPAHGRIELVNVATGKHEIVRQSVQLPGTDLAVIRDNLLSFIDSESPNRKRGRRGDWERCRAVVAKAFEARVL